MTSPELELDDTLSESIKTIKTITRNEKCQWMHACMDLHSQDSSSSSVAFHSHHHTDPQNEWMNEWMLPIGRLDGIPCRARNCWADNSSSRKVPPRKYLFLNSDADRSLSVILNVSNTRTLQKELIRCCCWWWWSISMWVTNSQQQKK